MNNSIEQVIARMKERGEVADAQLVQELFDAFVTVAASHMHAQELLLEQNPNRGRLN